jgi:sodium-dependent dicarboxylate transporter 2/3/5
VTDVGSNGVVTRNGKYRLVALLVAVTAAVAGFLLAPGDWPPGPAIVTLDYREIRVLSAEVTLGSEDSVTLQAGDAIQSAAVSFPRGLSLDQPLAALIRITEGGAPSQPAVADVELNITLSDGRVELLPASEWDDDEQALSAFRRPTEDAGIVIGLLGFVVIMWVTEAVPLFVTSLFIPFTLVVTGVGSAAAATAPFANPIIVLFFAGFLMAEAMTRSGLDHWVSMNITGRAGRSAAFLFGSMLALAAFLSMWMSNTAATAVLVPIALAVTAPLAHRGYREALVLSIAYAATVGGVGSAIGTPANQLAIEFLGDFGGRHISFVEWFTYGLPMVIVFLPVMAIYMWRTSRVQVDPDTFARARQVAADEMALLGPPGRDQIVVVSVFAFVAIGWLTEYLHGVHPGIVALGGAIVLFVLGRLQPEDLGNISWPSLLTFGGGLTLGLFLVETGVSDYVASRLAGLAGLPVVVAVLVVALITLLLTTVASNTASAAILIPMAIPLAAVLGIEPTLLVVVVAIASSIDFALVIGTPPTMIAYSTKLYTAAQIFRRGIVLDLAGIAVLVLLVTRFWEWVGLL